MPRKNTRNTRGRIIAAAWKLFYEQGYEDTTIEDIVFESGTSRGSFYHYFEGKDALLGTLSHVFDEQYERLRPTLSDDMDAVAKLRYLNHELFRMIEDRISRDLLARLLSTQLFASGEKHLLDQNRLYFRLLRDICRAGRESGQLRGDMTTNEMIKAYALWERALLYDWCLCGGDYALAAYADRMTPVFLESFRGAVPGADAAGEIPVAAGIVTRGGKVMLCQRKPSDRLSLKWEFPGGKLEAGETFGRALERELGEELGVRVRSGRICDARRVANGGRTYLIAFLLAELAEGEPRPIDCNAIRWVEPEALASYDLAPADAAVAQAIAREGLEAFADPRRHPFDVSALPAGTY